MRTFLALNIPSSFQIQQLYTDLQKNCNGLSIKYTDAKQGHLTLSFLGETNSQQIEKLHDDFSELSLGFTKIQLELKGLGVFKNLKHPQVVWIGFNIPIELKKMFEAINIITQKHGYKRDHASFSPHYTIGRIKQAGINHNLSAFLEKYKETVFGKIDISEFIFYESILKPAGPIYKPLYKYPLV